MKLMFSSVENYLFPFPEIIAYVKSSCFVTCNNHVEQGISRPDQLPAGEKNVNKY